ncbi:MAG: hypothetical protein CMJ94_04560 [Planctomycetes bacterium]|nr:hypothetical protein [Planctomycetota bacterium]
MLLLTLSLGWAAGAPAQEAVRGQVGALRYEAPPGYAELAQRLTTEADRDLADAHRWLGLDRGQGAIPDPQPGILYWVRNRQELAARLGREEVPDWYAAVARPLQGDMILAVEVAGGESRLRATMRHEIIHHAMGALPAEVFRRIPAWFHEGLAEAYSGEIYLGEVGVSLPWLANNNALPSLRTYADGFPQDSVKAAQGYAIGHAFVQRLIRVHGRPVIGEILERMRLGDNLDQALLATTRMSLIEHEVALTEELRSLRALLAASSPHFITLLFVGAALLIPFALRRRARRRRAMEQRWEREDEAAAEREERLASHAEALEAWMEREVRRRRGGPGAPPPDPR